MILLKELFYKFDHLHVIFDDDPSAIESYVSSIDMKSCGSNIKHEYPLGIKNYNCLNEKRRFCILMKDEKEIMGYAIFSLHDLLMDGEINEVIHLSDLRISFNFSEKGKREWKRAFLEIVSNYKNIEEFKDATYFYTLLVEENISTQNMINTWKSRIRICKKATYENCNIFGKKVEIGDSKLLVRYADLDDLNSINDFLQKQSLQKGWSDNPEYPPKDLRTYILKKRCLICIEDGQIVGHALCVNLDMRKEVVDKMSSLLKLAGSFLPLFDKSKMKSGNFIDSTYLKYFEADHSHFPLDRVEIFKQIINFVLNNEGFKKRELISFTSFEDLAMIKASEAFLGITTKMDFYEISENSMNIPNADEMEYIKSRKEA